MLTVIAVRVDRGAKLIRSRQQQRLRERLEVVLHFSEMRFERGQQRFVGRGICRAVVVDRFDESSAEVVRPEPIRDRLREERVVGGGHPGREDDSTIGHAGKVGGLRAERSRRD